MLIWDNENGTLSTKSEWRPERKMSGMNMNLRTVLAGMMLVGLMALTLPVQAEDYQRVYDAKAHKYVYVPKKTMSQKITTGAKKAWQDPVVKKGIIGAGVGLGAAALTDRSKLKGSLVGAGVGAGWGLLDKSKTMQDKPLLRQVSKGALTGAGVGAATGHKVLPSAVVGAGAGAAVHYVKTH
jgi:hypothetical protein